MNNFDFNKFNNLFSNNYFNNFNADEFHKNLSEEKNDFFNDWKIPSYVSPITLNDTETQDTKVLTQYRNKVIAGYLNLGVEDGWEEGSDTRIGAAFTRYILTKYFLDGKKYLGANEPILEKVIQGFKDVGSMEKMSVFHPKVEDGHRPKNCRACYDAGVTGWQKHTVSRMVGNLASTYDPNKPFFEILINSARSGNDPHCQPFFVSIYRDEKELDERRKKLVSLDLFPSNLAHHSFYASYLKSPEDFLIENETRLGPNSQRILKGLTFLKNTTVNVQKVGNCWIKQPMRCLLASITLEFLSQRPEMAPEEAFDEAKAIYKRIQKTTAIPYMEFVLDKTVATSTMRENALRAIEHQKKL